MAAIPVAGDCPDALICRKGPWSCGGQTVVMLEFGAMRQSQPVRKAGSAIELQVEKVGQLFDTLDPQPFRERDLDREAEEYIVSWARELPHRLPVCIRVHMPAAEAAGEQALHLEAAMRRYFAYRMEIAASDLTELFRHGRYSLLVGICVLALCVVGGGFFARMIPNFEVARFVSEGFIILGWVANWRPIEIFLYDWWPIVRRRKLFERLSRARIEVKAR